MNKQICEKCKGTMSRNLNKKLPNHPDWICDQVNGECGQISKAGKWFATGAWDEPFQSNVQAAKTATQPQNNNGNVSPEVWEAKDRMNCMQTAVNAASEIYQGSGEIDRALQDALKFYDLLRQAKSGVVKRYKAPISEVGKKIANAINDDEEINVEDIPFN